MHFNRSFFFNVNDLSDLIVRVANVSFFVWCRTESVKPDH